MSIMDFINKYRKQFLVSQINRKDIPDFNDSDIVRKHLTFSGKVQGVGFRVEAYGIADRLNLVGWVKNLRNGDVEVEVEGENKKIAYMIDYLTSIRRAPVNNVDTKDIETLSNEDTFTIVG